MINFLATFASLLVLLLGVPALALFVLDRALRASGYRGPHSDHFDGVRFYSYGPLPPQPPAEGQRSILAWMLARKANPWTDREVSQSKPIDRIHGGNLVVTFIGHSTVLIQTEGLNILTDPVFVKRASPFTFMGPRRYTLPGIRFEDLPPIDVVLLSHNHYDHMDVRTLRKLDASFRPRFFTHLGNAAHLERKGIRGATDFDWFDRQHVSGDVSVRSVPAQHFSARALSDRNKTLWGGFVIEAPHGNLYFAGDTGFGPFVEKIRDQYPDGFRMGLLPIGAFKPEWFMGPVHVSPDQAASMKEILGIKNAIAIHFGTFKLADDREDEAVIRLEELHAAGKTEQFRVLGNGGSVQIP